MTCYVVIHEWTRRHNYGVDVIGVTFDKKNAENILTEKRNELIKDANAEDWFICDDTNTSYIAYDEDEPGRGGDSLSIHESSISENKNHT